MIDYYMKMNKWMKLDGKGTFFWSVDSQDWPFNKFPHLLGGHAILGVGSHINWKENKWNHTHFNKNNNNIMIIKQKIIYNNHKLINMHYDN